jgi:hypothetical protein
MAMRIIQLFHYLASNQLIEISIFVNKLEA